MTGRYLGLVSLRFVSLLFPNKQTEDLNKQNVGYQDKSASDTLNLVENERDNNSNAIRKSTEKILRSLLEVGSPGMTICIAKRGKIIWRSAFGFCDVENLLPCDEFSSMKIASISKSIFAATMVAPLLDRGKLNLKASIHDYLSADEFPRQTYDGNEYDITIEQLLSHTSGVRHYNNNRDSDKSLKPIGSAGSTKVYQYDNQYNREDFFSRTTFRNVIDALKLFKDDMLACKPGEYLYSTYGYTLLSAVIQKILQQDQECKELQIEDAWIGALRKEWNMKDTYLDHDEVLIPLRARHYRRDGRNKELINIPFIDTSSKWAGGGLMSNTTDLVNFGTRLIDLSKGRDVGLVMRPQIIDQFWTEVKNHYGLGFRIIKDKNEQVIYHTGCSVGSSSILLMKPESEIVVAILTNVPDINLVPLSLYIADQFETSSK